MIHLLKKEIVSVNKWTNIITPASFGMLIEDAFLHEFLPEYALDKTTPDIHYFYIHSKRRCGFAMAHVDQQENAFRYLLTRKDLIEKKPDDAFGNLDCDVVFGHIPHYQIRHRIRLQGVKGYLSSRMSSKKPTPYELVYHKRGAFSPTMQISRPSKELEHIASYLSTKMKKINWQENTATIALSEGLE